MSSTVGKPINLVSHILGLETPWWVRAHVVQRNYELSRPDTFMSCVSMRLNLRSFSFMKAISRDCCKTLVLCRPRKIELSMRVAVESSRVDILHSFLTRWRLKYYDIISDRWFWILDFIERFDSVYNWFIGKVKYI